MLVRKGSTTQIVWWVHLARPFIVLSSTMAHLKSHKDYINENINCQNSVLKQNFNPRSPCTQTVTHIYSHLILVWHNSHRIQDVLTFLSMQIFIINCSIFTSSYELVSRVGGFYTHVSARRRVLMGRATWGKIRTVTLGHISVHYTDLCSPIKVPWSCDIM